MEDADRVNEDVDADEVGVAEPEPERRHRDDESGSSVEEEMEEEEEEEPRIPTPEEVELEYTYPQDFVGRSWEDVVQRRYFRLILDPSCITVPPEKFRYCEYLIEIVYPEGADSKLLRIGQQAFEKCCNLHQMNPFPDGLVELDYSAFDYCRKLQGRITIPPSIQFVRSSCFSDCNAITSVVFESSSATTTVVELDSYIFRYCEELLSVRLPINLRVIPMGCFVRCCSLIDVPIPGTVHEVRTGALHGCSSLVSLDLPENVNLIQDYACARCTALKTVAIRSSSPNLRVGNAVFDSCPSLETIKVYPWIFPKLFHALDSDSYHLNFTYKFYRKYEHQIALYRQQQQQQQRQS